VVLVAVAIASLSAQQPATPPPFRFERPIVTGGAGPKRLAIDVPLLGGAAPFRTAIRQDQGNRATTIAVGDGLRDLRLYDAAGAEVGYILLGTPPAAPVYTSAVTLPVAPVDTDTVKTSGFEADLGEPMIVDRLRSEEHTSELQSLAYLVCRLLLEKKKN